MKPPLASGNCGGGGGGGIDITPANEPPVAACADPQELVASADTCTAAMPDVDDGSSDADGDELLFTQDPAAGTSLGLGTTTVSLNVSDGQAEDDCATSVTVVDETAPSLSCNAAATLTPPDAGTAFTATATDSCGGAVTVTATGTYTCTAVNGAGKVVDKSDDCELTFDGDTVTVADTSGVGTQITYTVEATDEAGNVTSTVCELDIVSPGNGGGNGGGGDNCNNGGGNGDEGCSPANSDNANDDESGNKGKGKGKK